MTVPDGSHTGTVDYAGAARGVRWGKRRSERIALGLPHHQEPDRRDMKDVAGRHRRALILCMEHDMLLGVLTDTALVTRHADKPYPDTSGSVMAPCPLCARERRVVWSVDVRKLRRLMRTPDRRRPRPVDVREVAPDVLLTVLREHGLTS